MPRGASIVNIGTVVSHLTSLPGVAVYGASKAAQDYLTGALAKELGRTKGIRVNTVAPGGTSTDADGWYPAGEMRDEVSATLGGLTKLELRAGLPEEVADAVLFVVSNHARWITGQYIAVSGGS
jgi:NAD(P)-dependent dehydrogenase (short-subunit alcohol dehydrogenase family)